MKCLPELSKLSKVNSLAKTNKDGASEAISERDPFNKAQALQLVEGLEPGRDGLLVKGTCREGSNEAANDDAEERDDNEHIAWVDRGDAIAFYNYKDDGSARLDWRAIHCGLPTTDEDGCKWIANHWYRANVLAEL